jgi:hypothetical protein
VHEHLTVCSTKNTQQLYILNQPFKKHAIIKGVPGMSEFRLVLCELELELNETSNLFNLLQPVHNASNTICSTNFQTPVACFMETVRVVP